MNENETKEEVKTEESVDTTDKKETVEAKVDSSAAEKEGGKNNKTIPYIISVVIVAILLGGVLYKLESEGRSSTNIFGSIIEMQQSKSAKATVNGENISGSELALSIKQFEQAAAAQGIDMANPEVLADVTSQALEVLINTELLRQEAVSQGFEISDDEVNARLQEIESQIGSPDVLEERMQALGIDQERLRMDISNELLIQKLLDQKFAEANIEVTDEEISQLYESVGGGAEGVPALEEVRDQIVEQITVTKEQQVVDETLSTLKAVAEIEIL